MKEKIRSLQRENSRLRQEVERQHSIIGRLLTNARTHRLRSQFRRLAKQLVAAGRVPR